ncbi:hypothetical protein RYX36_023993, partial [Vicia faba]
MKRIRGKEEALRAYQVSPDDWNQMRQYLETNEARGKNWRGRYEDSRNQRL